MITRLLTLAICLLMSGAIQAQQLPPYSFFMYNITALNPSLPRPEFIFDDYSFFLNSTYRMQWLGVEDAPHTFLFQAGTWLPDWDNKLYKKLGNTHAGIDIVSDHTGPYSFNGVYARLGHLIFLGGNGWQHSAKTFLAGGLNIGLISHRFATDDPMLQNDSDVIACSGMTMIPDVGFGVSFNHYFTRAGQDFADSQGFYVGFSMPQMMAISPVCDFDTNPEGHKFDRVRHYYFVAGARIGRDAENFRANPSIMAQYAPVTDSDLRSFGQQGPWYINGSMEVTLQEYLILSLGLDINGSITARAGVNIPMDGPQHSNGDALKIAVGFASSEALDKVNGIGNTLEFTATYMIDYQEY